MTVDKLRDQINNALGENLGSPITDESLASVRRCISDSLAGVDSASLSLEVGHIELSPDKRSFEVEFQAVLPGTIHDVILDEPLDFSFKDDED